MCQFEKTKPTIRTLVYIYWTSPNPFPLTPFQPNRWTSTSARIWPSPTASPACRRSCSSRTRSRWSRSRAPTPTSWRRSSRSWPNFRCCSIFCCCYHRHTTYSLRLRPDAGWYKFQKYALAFHTHTHSHARAGARVPPPLSRTHTHTHSCLIVCPATLNLVIFPPLRFPARISNTACICDSSSETLNAK